jgi:hypothetical protein
MKTVRILNAPTKVNTLQSEENPEGKGWRRNGKKSRSQGSPWPTHHLPYELDSGATRPPSSVCLHPVSKTQHKN